MVTILWIMLRYKTIYCLWWLIIVTLSIVLMNWINNTNKVIEHWLKNNTIESIEYGWYTKIKLRD